MSNKKNWRGSITVDDHPKPQDPMPHYRCRPGQARACGRIDCSFSDLIRACLELGVPVLKKHLNTLLPILGADINFVKGPR